MRDYSVSIGEREYQVKLENGSLTVNGEMLDVDLVPLNGSGMHLLRRNRQALELHFSQQMTRTVQVLVEGHLVQVQIHPWGWSGHARRKAGSQGDLSAPMPGLVVEVYVKEGQVVQKGELLVVIESMKMQMQMRSPLNGRVCCVSVKAGEQVQKGQLLVEMDATGASGEEIPE